MAVAFDAVGPSSAGASVASNRNLSWSHTVTGSNTALLVGVAVDAASDAGWTFTCTYNSVSMTQLAAIHANAGTSGMLVVFGLAGPATGAHTVAFAVAGGSIPGDMEGGSLSFTGADQAATFGTPVTGTGSSTTPSVAVTSNTSGNIIGGFIGVGDTVNSTTSPGTSRFVDNFQAGGGNAVGNAAGQTSPSTGSTVTVAWGTAIAPWAVVAVEVLAFAVVTGTPQPPQYRILGRPSRLAETYRLNI